ncbi:hypothetical protein R3I93_001173 [Phoxinus phoxinus]|uniref:Ig-like domain-containing protein n=1 Tax=Phoxinus phoxinus TaxID=58324 RepID=A0AAN9DQZ3_9TELE
MSLVHSGLSQVKPVVTVKPDQRVFRGERVTLTCDIQGEGDIQWRYSWTRDGDTVYPYTTAKAEFSFTAGVSSSGEYRCRGGRSHTHTDFSDAVTLTVSALPASTVTVTPASPVFTGETVDLKCVINSDHSNWRYEWIKDSVKLQTSDRYTVNTHTLSIVKVITSDQGQYWCKGQRDGRPNSSTSGSVYLSVKAEAQASVRVSPQPWLTEGESGTLICEVSGSSTGWTFSWFRDHDHLSDSSRGAGGSYTLSPAALQHTGVYTCRAERGRPAYYTHNSSAHTLWITGVSASVSLVLKPSRSQHFSSDSLSLSCEDQSNSTGWTVRRYTDKHTQTCAKQTGSSCVIASLSTSDTGVYWCESESGEKRRPRNITVHDGEVILESSVDPVTEGETLTLHCLHRPTNSPILSADFYKDGSLIQNQTTGAMSITTVSKSHEGFYYCKTERGQSLHSWISVRGQISVFHILSFPLAASPYLLATVVLLYKCYRARVSSEEQSQYAVTEEETSI